jgi:lipopolysaccharide transport system ATP-binding protein
MKILEIQHISKKFKINHTSEPYLSLRDNIFKFFKKKNSLEDFWALKDIHFDVHAGESVGIIGRNGAGKSTLLKILSKITPPTSGKIISRGRIASLLEVGTGFHPELTGRENIFMNGSILGMRKVEILKNFDAIVDFADITNFIDTPLKHYSSGMQLRLAFAVAAFLENEILIIDEVLAVGDAEFQKKCMGKMEDVSKNQGRTVLFVSHNVAAIQSLCNVGVYINKGVCIGTRSVGDVLHEYLYGDTSNKAEYVNEKINLNKNAEILSARLLDEKENPQFRFSTNEKILLEIKWIKRTNVNISPNFMLINQNGQKVMMGADVKDDWYGDKKQEIGNYQTTIIIPNNLLNANEYFFHLALDTTSPSFNHDVKENILQMTVYDPLDLESIHRGNFTTLNSDVSVWPILDSFTKKI